MLQIESYSREYQDFFVLSMLNGKRNGTYLEVGGATPIQDSNTYLLESKFDWSGISIEWNDELAALWGPSRRNICICADATLIDYEDLLETHVKKRHLDYLQLDIDPPFNTFTALLKINFFKYSFSVITYEHDFYIGGNFERIASRRILEGHGYKRVVSDVCHGEYAFEDWYIHPNYVPKSLYAPFLGDGVNLAHGSCDAKYAELFKLGLWSEM